MYHYVCIGGYLLWRYSYVLEYGYTTLHYANALRHFVFDKESKNEEQDIFEEDWVYFESKEPSVIIEKIDI